MKNLLRPFLGLTILISLAGPAWAQKADPCAAVKSQLAMGNISRAEALLEQLMAKTPCIPEALALKGRIVANNNGPKAALTFYDQALKCGPLPRENILEIATAYSLLERHQDAARLLEEFLLKNPDDSEFLHELGLTYLALNELEKAKERLQKGQELAPENAVLAADYALSLIYTGALDKAILLLEETIKKAPKEPAPRLVLGNAFNLRGELKRAISAYEAGLELDPKATSARYHLARLYQQSGALDKATLEFKRLLNSEFQQKACFALIETALLKGDLQEGEKWLKAAEHNKIISAEKAATYRAEIARTGGDNGRAKKLLLPLVEAGQADKLVWKILLAIAEEENDHILKKRALSELKK